MTEQVPSDIMPNLHQPSSLKSALLSGDLRSNALLETIAALAKGEMWRRLWMVADALSREVSVLFDRDGRIWVDIGTSGQVRLSHQLVRTSPSHFGSTPIHGMPIGAQQTWNPSGILSILDKAIVLGHDHMKTTNKAEGGASALDQPGHSRFGPQNQ